MVAHVQTRFPHELAVGDQVEFVGGDVAAWNGRFAVTEVDPPKAGVGLSLGFKCFTKDALTLPSTPMLAFNSPAPTMPIQSITTAGGIMTVTTATKHKRLAGEWVTVSGANDAPADGTNASYNGDIASLRHLPRFRLPFRLLHIPSPANPYADTTQRHR